jgi:hypothetical protein
LIECVARGVLSAKKIFEEFASVEIFSDRRGHIHIRTWYTIRVRVLVPGKLNISPVRFFANGETEANKTSLAPQLQTASSYFTAE